MKRFIAGVIFSLWAASALAGEFTPETRVIDLETSNVNGHMFGPAVMGTNGIEIRKPFDLPPNRKSSQVLIAGKKCQIRATYASGQHHTFDMGHHYGLFSLSSYKSSDSVEIYAANIYHNPMTFLVDCQGAGITVGEVEEDLGHTIRFY